MFKMNAKSMPDPGGGAEYNVWPFSNFTETGSNHCGLKCTEFYMEIKQIWIRFTGILAGLVR